MTTDTPLSRASPLPQGFAVNQSNRIQHLTTGLAVTATDNAIASGGLSLVERLVGVAEPQGRIGVRRVEGRQANAQADFQRRVLLIAQRRKAIAQGVHRGGGTVERQVRKDHAELVAAV